ncbi:hypothetical protein [Actinoplanes sp. NBRC 101535]|uniref:hypothetical protein n=1 Tax=Actinoplanes sp. NBRC 101535 TaxID=3032196 RepID=UPI0024A492F7|nr:hypothetical protein [Actinoplanes sp. NBRC 101535]GLY02931.1 hypothetical protein Acsp01_33100 [Actinoplanes sp. NBRC 101535]
MRIVGLFLLAAWCAECAWGGFTPAGYPMVLLFLAPLYGGAALLIREAGRRAGAGWPGLALLAAAFGLVQAGLVDQSLFDPAALAGTEFADAGRQATATTVPALGFSAEQLFTFVGGHVWLSICAPIALVEACVHPERRHTPWLGPAGITVTALAYTAASLVIFSDSGAVAGRGQIGFVVVVAVALIAVALLQPRRWRPFAGHPSSRPRPGPRPRPRPRRGGAVTSPPGEGVPVLWVGGVVAAGHLAGWFFPASWTGLALRVLTVAVVVALMLRWVSSTAHALAAWSAGVLVAAAGAWLTPPYQAASPAMMLAGDIVTTLVAVGVVTFAFRRLRSRSYLPRTTYAEFAPSSATAPPTKQKGSNDHP